MELFRKLYICFAEICAFFMQNKKHFANFFHLFLQKLIFQKESVDFFRFFCITFHAAQKIFHVRYALLHAIKN